FTRRGRGNVRLRDSGAKAGVKLYTIVPAEKPAPVVEEVEAEEVGADEEAAAAEAALVAAKKKKQTMLIGAAAAVVVIIAGGAGVLLFSKPKSESATPAVTRPKT